jgi:hypothetical protein
MQGCNALDPHVLPYPEYSYHAIYIALMKWSGRDFHNLYPNTWWSVTPSFISWIVGQTSNKNNYFDI